MNLEFSLLVVDDAPDSIREAIDILRDNLEAKGFTLDLHSPDDFSERGLRELARLKGKDYDLVMVDYNLGHDETDGAIAAHRLRLNLPYTDMVFYSSVPGLNLHGKLAEQEVAGVFISRREDLGDTLTGIADTVIGKAVDLNHMRGIAMAEVAEMDVFMEETLGRAFRYAGDRCIEDATNRTIRRLRESTQEDSVLLENCFEEDGLPGVVSNSRLFSFAQKFQAVRRVVRCLPEKPSEALDVLSSYENEVIKNRNMLAHVKEETTADGTTILRSIKDDGGVVIDDSWMTDFRLKLKAHRSALAHVCQALDKHFGAVGAAHHPEEC